MSLPETDPTEGVTVSAADMAILADELKILRTQRDQLLEAMRDALSVCRSVSISQDRRVKRDGVAMYLQTEEWCHWVEDEVGPKLEAAIAQATGQEGSAA